MGFFCVGTISQLKSMNLLFLHFRMYFIIDNEIALNDWSSITMAELVKVASVQLTSQFRKEKLVNWISLEMFQFSNGFLLYRTIGFSLLHFRMYFSINNEMALKLIVLLLRRDQKQQFQKHLFQNVFVYRKWMAVND